MAAFNGKVSFNAKSGDCSTHGTGCTSCGNSMPVNQCNSSGTNGACSTCGASSCSCSSCAC